MMIRFLRTTARCILAVFLLSSLASWAAQDRRSVIYDLGMELERLSTSLAQESFDHFKGWNGTISDQEQAILFKSEAFAASCRLFLRLTEARSGYYRDDFLRTNIYNAFTYLAGSFSDAEEEMRKGGVMPYSLSDCRKILSRMEREFSQWPAADNLAYLDQRYVKARDATVYLIERSGIGNYVRLPFKNLESLWRYNYDRNRGKDPWKYLVEVSYNTLDKMRKGRMIDLTFEGRMVIEQGVRRDRPVYLIEGGKKRGLTRADLVNRYGGWSKVYEVPREVIDSYPDGDPIL
ncbi:MAG: hypothetical protein NTV82_06220 [Candidatus Aminicenantes bacterium]|nr:hypothetical protein [Candidatus Aminicenantes bacterium]